jgi:tetratricopeptide (TPR) repeat protein
VSLTEGAVLDEARVLAVRGRVQEALACLDVRLAERPDDVGALLLRGQLLLQVREEQAALESLSRAAALAPRDAEALDGLARALHALGRDAEALSVAQEARRRLGEGENFRHAASVYLTIVWCLREQRHYREALEAAEEGLRRCPDAVLAQWASVVEEELAEAEQERC